MSQGLDGPAAVVASGEWEVERYVRRLLYTLGVVETVAWWTGRPVTSEPGERLGADAPAD